MLLDTLETEAATLFQRLRLFTTSPEASAFYEEMGYEPVLRVTKVSHEKQIGIGP